MNWAMQNGKALPLAFARHVKRLQTAEKQGKRLPEDDILSELEHGSVASAPLGRDIFSLR
jgi:hypothetical protein